MLEQQKSKEKQQVGKKNKTPLEGELLPMQAHSAPTKQRIPYHIHASLSSSHPPAWKRKQQKKKKPREQNANTRPPSLHQSHCCRSGVVACAPVSKKETWASPRYRPLLHGITSCAALPVCQKAQRAARSTAWRRTTAVFLVHQTCIGTSGPTLCCIYLHEREGTAYVNWKVSVVE